MDLDAAGAPGAPATPARTMSRVIGSRAWDTIFVKAVELVLLPRPRLSGLQGTDG